MSFDKLDKLTNAFLRKEYLHMSKYFWNGKRKELTKHTPNRIKAYAEEIYELYWDSPATRLRGTYSHPGPDV